MSAPGKRSNSGLLSIVWSIALLSATIPPAAATVQPEPEGRLFPETGKTVSARFLDYWNTHGGLPQQGYPISEEISNAHTPIARFISLSTSSVRSSRLTWQRRALRPALAGPAGLSIQGKIPGGYARWSYIAGPARNLRCHS